MFTNVHIFHDIRSLSKICYQSLLVMVTLGWKVMESWCRGLPLRSMVSRATSKSSSSPDTRVTWLDARLRKRRLGRDCRTAGRLVNRLWETLSWVSWPRAESESGREESWLDDKSRAACVCVV